MIVFVEMNAVYVYVLCLGWFLIAQTIKVPSLRSAEVDTITAGFNDSSKNRGEIILGKYHSLQEVKPGFDKKSQLIYREDVISIDHPNL